MAAWSPNLHRNGRFARDVRAGLTKPGQKQLSPEYFYDDLGTALFEAITHLPEYGLTRAEKRLLEQHSAEVLEYIAYPALVVELGSGNGRKTRLLLEALAARGALSYRPIDVSASALLKCRQGLSDLSGVTVNGVHAPFLEGLHSALADRQPGQNALVLFLGSTVGNFDRAQAEGFLSAIRGAVHAGDALMLGADLEKSVPDMLLAYDDPAGVTAAFNLNVLGRINRELGGEFDLRRFSHRAVYNERERRVEMHIASSDRQTVAIRAAGIEVSFEKGETVWTESCHKFSRSELDRMAARAGFAPAAQWIDERWPFALSLLIAEGTRSAGE